MTDFSEEWLRLYYERLFPAEVLCKWLDHGRMMSLLPKREFSFTLAGDIYIRYLSFNNARDLLREIKRKQPHKIDIGAVYNIPPNKHNSVRPGSFKPRERELVFDIDLTDYEDVMGPRENSKSIWGFNNNKWVYMSTAMRVVSQVLREDFGYSDFVWIFSGRRGVHCWVNDIEARQLIDKKRAALMKYLTVLVGKKLEINFPMHPALERFIPLLNSCFEALCTEEDILNKEENLNHILGLIPDSELSNLLGEHFQSTTNSSLVIWDKIRSTILEKANKLLNKNNFSKEGRNLKGSLTQILFYYCFPRLDVNVSTHRNHLLKSPFVAHPKTGKICVPIPEESIDKFDPEAVPTLRTLVNELNEKQASSLQPYVEAFEAQLKPDKINSQVNIQDSDKNDAMQDVEVDESIPSW